MHQADFLETEKLKMVRAALSLKVTCLKAAQSSFAVEVERGDGLRLREGACVFVPVGDHIV